MQRIKLNLKDEQVKSKCEKEANIIYGYEKYSCNNYKVNVQINQSIR